MKSGKECDRDTMYKNKNDTVQFSSCTSFVFLYLVAPLLLLLFFVAFLWYDYFGTKTNHDDNNDTNRNENFFGIYFLSFFFDVCVCVSGFSLILVAVTSVLKQISPKPKSIDDDNVREMTQNTSVIYNADIVFVDLGIVNLLLCHSFAHPHTHTLEYVQ